MVPLPAPHGDPRGLCGHAAPRPDRHPALDQDVGAGALALEIFYEHAKRGLPHPHLAIRSHRHTYADSYDAHPTRLIQLPAWQVKTAHAHKVVPESIADIGGIIVTIYPNGKYEVEPKLYCPELPAVWKASA